MTLKQLKRKCMAEGARRGYKKALLEGRMPVQPVLKPGKFGPAQMPTASREEGEAYAAKQHQKYLDNMAWDIESTIKSWAKSSELEMVLSNLSYDELEQIQNALALLDD